MGCSWLETFTYNFFERCFTSFWKFGVNIIPLLYFLMLCIKPSMSLLQASWTFKSRKIKYMARPYILSILICTNTFMHAKNSFKWRMTFLSSDVESKKVFTNIHQSFWVHCLTKTICPHDMAHFNYIKVVWQGRFIDFWNTYFSR